MKSWKFIFHCSKSEDSYISIDSLVEYNDTTGFGFDFATGPTAYHQGTDECLSQQPYYFSLKLDEGNYNVNIKCGSITTKADTTIKAQSRRLLFHNIHTQPGEFVDCAATINIKTPVIANNGGLIKLNDREREKLSWQDKLILEINGPLSAISKIEISPADAITIFTAGNSTVVDQDDDPYASWPQMITKYFKSGVAISNHAESGLSINSFIASGRLKKILSTIKPNDFFFIEFGHIDKKEKIQFALKIFISKLEMMVRKAKERGAIPVLVTPINRRYFNEDSLLANTLGDFPDAIREVAGKHSTILIDLHLITRLFLEQLGPECSKRAFVCSEENYFATEKQLSKDNTHLNVYGAVQVAKFMVKEIFDKIPRLRPYLRVTNPEYSPLQPNDFDEVKWSPSPRSPVANPKN